MVHDACSFDLPLQKKGPVHEAWANRGGQTKYINIAQEQVHITSSDQSK